MILREHRHKEGSEGMQPGSRENTVRKMVNTSYWIAQCLCYLQAVRNLLFVVILFSTSNK